MAKSQAALSAGMVQLLAPVVEQCDTRLGAVLKAQETLAKQIDAFSAELVKAEREKDGEHADAQLGSYAAKLAASRKKLKKVEMLAIQTRNRVENIERMHEQLLVSEKNFKDRQGKTEELLAENAGTVAAQSECAETIKDMSTSGVAVEEGGQEVVAEPAATEEAEASPDAAEEPAEGNLEQGEQGAEQAGGERSGSKKKKK